jgi:fatty acid desaturase 2 (delta-6 desaturase)
MGKGGFNPLWDLPEYSWDEIRKHCTKQDRWIVLHDGVYDVTDWCKKHPGGERIIGHFGGHDATVCLLARGNLRLLHSF